MHSTNPRPAGEVTQLLLAVQSGDPDASERLLTAIYDELKALAGREIRREFSPPTLSATELVHEAYLKLVGAADSATSRVHFLGIAARAMRQVLVDQARRRKSSKRGDGFLPVTLSELHPAGEATDAEEILELHDALDKLSEQQRQIVECRFFAGLDESEVAALLGVSDRTVRREWVRARARLYKLMYGGSNDQNPAHSRDNHAD